MACDKDILRDVPLFALLDDDERAVLAAQVDVTRFAPRQRIYKIGDPGGRAYVLVSGAVRVTTVDEDHQDVVVDEPAPGDFFGFASMLDQTPHQTTAVALDESVCLEVDRHDIETLLQRKPHAATFGEHVADIVAGFGGSWTFIITFLAGLLVYSIVNVVLRSRAWDPYPFILLNLILSMIAALQAPVIMMSQNRQDTKDRLRGELDFDVNRRAESEVQGLSRKLNAIAEKIDDLEDLVRQKAST